QLRACTQGTQMASSRRRTTLGGLLPPSELPRTVISGREFGFDDCPQHRAQLLRAPGAERFFESLLRLSPRLGSRLKTFLARLTQLKFLGPAVRCRWLDPD